MALKPLNSVAGFSVGETPANIILANGDITTNNITTTGKANLNAISNVIITGGTAGQVIQTDGAGNLTFTTINTAQLANGNSNVQVYANGNIAFSSTGNANVAVITGTGMNVAGYITGANITATGNISVNNYIVTPSTVDLIVAPDTQLTRFYSNVNPFSGGYSLGNSLARWDNVFANTANIDGNVSAGNVLTNNLLYANGQPWDLQEAAGANKEIQYNDGSNNFGASANFTFDYATNLLTVNGNAQFNNANLGNLATANFVNASSNINVTNTMQAGNVRTDNLLYANGNPWDLQEAAGANTQIQYNDGSNNFGASANFTYNDATQLFTVLGNSQFNNANLGNLAIANFVNVASNVTASNVTVNLALSGNTANFTGNVSAGNLSTTGSGGNITMTGGNIVGANVVIANSFTSNGGVIDFATNNPNVNLGNVGNVHIGGGSNGQILQTDGAGNLSWSSAPNISIIQNGDSNVNIPTANGNVNTSVGGNANILVVTGTGANVTGYFTASANLTAANANLGNLVTANFANFANDVVVQGNIANANNVSVTNALNANTGNFSGNITSLNANLGNLATANFVNVASNITASNVTVNLELSGNTANFTGNITAANGNLGNLVTANYANFANDVVVQGNIANANNISVTNTITSNNANISSNTTTNNLTVNLELSGNTANFSGNVIVPNLTVNLELSGNTANFSGNVTVANIVGALANGTSNVKVYSNANVEFTINGVANVATISSTGLYVAGEINTTTGNMLSNGNVTANSFLNSANANVTGEALLGSVKTANITATVGNITISASGVDQNIILNPTGNGTVDVGSHRITQVADPTEPRDAATKEYVDSTSQGLTIHTAVRVTSTTNLNATYANGGSVLTTIAITGGKTIQFSAAHGLSIGDELAWDNSFNGLVGDDPYFVYSTPAADTITVKAGYFGAEVTTLTNGTGLSQTARANTGVGATLTNAGANVALSIDTVALSSTNRVLVQGQTNQVENGIYTVTTVGNGSTAWVLTRATDEDTYSPTSTSSLGYGDYFFVQQGGSYAGSSYVLTTPVGEILFGFTNIAFSQFSAAGAYSAGNGIAINGTVISANVDGVTTDIVGGNIVVKTSANLTTPNIGDATFSSLTWNNLSNGNVTANNLSIGNIANITGNLRVDGIIESNGNVTSNAFINGNNASFTNFANIGGNLLANNITSNHSLSSNTANISSNLVTSNATVNLELSGNTANFSGNVIVNNLTVNLELAGNTANFSGNVVALNTNAGNLLTANFANIASNVTTSNLTVNLELSGNTANFSGNIVALNTNAGNLLTANFANIASNVTTSNLTVNLELAGNTANFSGNITGANVIANTAVFAPEIVQNASTYDTRVTLSSVTGLINITSGANSTKFAPSGVIELGGASQIVGGTFGGSGVTLGASQTDIFQNRGGNVTVQTGTGGTTANTWTFAQDGNLYTPGQINTSTVNANTSVVVANTTITTGTVTTSSISANQTIASFNSTGVTGVEYLVKAVDATGSKYSVATVLAVTDGTDADYTIYGSAQMNGYTGSLAVNVSGGFIRLQVTPASSNSTVWTTQYRLI